MPPKKKVAGLIKLQIQAGQAGGALQEQAVSGGIEDLL